MPLTGISGSYTITIGGSIIDEVRFYPANAQMVTYTYDPAIGMTSSMDAKGMVTYYEYDNFQRLADVKDKNGNIIKAYCYNYAGQQVNCYANLAPTVFYARVEHTNFTNPTESEKNGSTDYYTYNDLSVHFYKDLNCTTPLILGAALSIIVDDNTGYYQDANGSTTYGQSVNTYVVPAGVSSYSLGNQLFNWIHQYTDAYGNTFNDMYTWIMNSLRPLTEVTMFKPCIYLLKKL